MKMIRLSFATIALTFGFALVGCEKASEPAAPAEEAPAAAEEAPAPEPAPAVEEAPAPAPESAPE